MKQDDREYTVVIGDISGSKRLNGLDRYQIQLFLKSAIVQVNEEFERYLEAPTTITKGDEFQVMIDTPGHAHEIVRAFQQLIFPVSVRYGIGVGTVYRMGGKLPIEMDGPAFHRANRALSKAKQKKSCVWFVSGNEQFDPLVNTIFLLISAIKSRWSERHYQLYWDYQKLGTYKKVAENQNVTPQAIGDMLKNIRATDIIEAENNLTEIFNQINHDLPHPTDGSESPSR